MAATPAPPAAPAAPAFSVDLHLAGRPDLTDATVVASLPADPRVQLVDLNHRLIKATPCLGWTEVPGAAPTDPPVAMSFSLSHLNLLCMIGGFGTRWLESETNVILMSHVPNHANGMWEAWVNVGGLDLNRVYDTIPKLSDAIMQAKLASGGDNRLLLVDGALFSNEARPGGGAGSAVDRT